MDDELKAFVARVEAFEIDADDKALRFVDRLARENRWTVLYAGRVVREYLRFCILAVRSGHPVTPSEDVDQAWHLHLTYTRSYWERFCGQTLGCPLHHEPTAGGVAEGNKFRNWYQATLDSYRLVFGSDPPRDIWPPAAQRFAHAGELKWMHADREWAVPKRWVVVGGGVLACSLATLASLGGGEADRPHFEAAASLAVAQLPFELGGSAFLSFYAALCLFGLALIVVLGMDTTVAADQQSPDDKVDELSADELAVLAGGGSRLAHVALTRLFAEQRITATKTLWWHSRFKTSGPPPEQPAIDRDLYTAIHSRRSPNQLIEVVRPHFQRIEAKLVEKGLRYPSGQKSIAATCVAVFIGLVGGLRLIQGRMLSEEVAILLGMVVAFGIAAKVINSRWSMTSPQGKTYLKIARAKFEPKPAAAADLEPAVLATSVALLGTAAVAGIAGLAPLAALSSSVGKASASTTWGAGCGAGCGGCSSGGGGGCGGGGCGGGCGGCGDG